MVKFVFQSESGNSQLLLLKLLKLLLCNLFLFWHFWQLPNSLRWITTTRRAYSDLHVAKEIQTAIDHQIRPGWFPGISEWGDNADKENQMFPLTWLVVCGFCCVGIGRRGATNGLDERAGDDDGAGVRVEQSGFQRADGVKEHSRETACEAQRGEPRQLRVQLTRVCRERGRT